MNSLEFNEKLQKSVCMEDSDVQNLHIRSWEKQNHYPVEHYTTTLNHL